MSEKLEEPAASPPADAEREEARRRIKKRRDLGEHLVVYLIINAGFWAMWALTGAGYPWPAWISGGWGIGLVLNAWEVYLRRPISEADVDRELQRRHSGRHALR